MKKTISERIEDNNRRQALLQKKRLYLKLLEKKEKAKQLIGLGNLLEKVGLHDINKNTLLGAFLEIKDSFKDSEKADIWTRRGMEFKQKENNHD